MLGRTSFALGGVIYEMVAGRKAFEGKSQASLIAAIMHVDPPAMSSLQVMSPPALDQVVKTCLVKDPDDRWHSAGDVERQLTWITEGGSQATVDGPVTAATQRVGWRQGIPLAVAAVAIGSTITGLVVWTLTHPAPEEPQALTRFVVTTTPEDALRMIDIQLDVAIARDGTRIVYVGGRQLHVRQLDRLDATPLQGTDGGTFPFFSPDGEWWGSGTGPR